MYVSIRRYKAKAPADFKRRVNEGFLPIISNANGFLGYYAIDTGAAEVASVSIFETRAGADESNKLAADWVKKNLAALGQPEKITGEVIAHRTQPARQLI